MFATTAVVAWALISAPTTPFQEPEIAFDGLGGLHRQIKTRSPKAQQFFDQGLAFMWAFNHDEAIRSFNTAIHYDPDCAMAYWGLAMANGGHINNPTVPPEREKVAFDALRKAMAYSGEESSANRALIEAATRRFADPQPADRSGLDLAYADAMRAVWKQYPTDPDIGALTAEALMNLHPWDFYEADGSAKEWTPEITGVLDATLKLNPKHPQACHLAIHAWEASNTPEKAKETADNLRHMQPALGHMVHMPSHIDVRLGDWKETVAANDRAIKADEAYRAQRPRIGFYRLYMSHNRHMLGLGAMMRGEGAVAIKSMDDMVAAIPEEAYATEMAAVLDGYTAMPYEVRIRFGKWDEILAMPDHRASLPISHAIWRMARGVAYAAKGDIENAKKEQALFIEAKSKVPEEAFMGNNTGLGLMAVAEPLLSGEILIAEGKMDEGIADLRKSVEAEDQLRYDEPPDWINPVRHPLGAALMKAGRFQEAVDVYRADLVKFPNNGWSLFGLSQALAALNQTEEADKYAKMFAEVWADADTQITSSCLCIPGKIGGR